MKMFVCTLLLLTTTGVAPLVAQQPALADLQARVAKNDPEAELELGRAYHLGQGVPQDFAKAIDLYRKAAAQGNAKAMYNLGYMYHRSQGVKFDDMVAAQWFQKAAEAGLPAAELEVGLAYYHGDNGQNQDYAASVKWLTLAAQHSDFPKESGMADNMLGVLYENGYGVSKDGAKALAWYEKAAALGSGKADGSLGRIYLEGSLAKRDPVEAYMWLKLGIYQRDMLSLREFQEATTDHTFTPEQISEGSARVTDYLLKHSGANPTHVITLAPGAATHGPTGSVTPAPAPAPPVPPPGASPATH